MKWLWQLLSGSKEEHQDVLHDYESLSLPEGSADEIARRALLTWRKGDRQGALALYDQAIAMMPDEASLYLNRGNLKIELELVDEAIADLEECRRMDPSMPTGNLDLLRMMEADPVLLAGFLERQRERTG